jgi:hypothetical protein
MHLQGQCLKGDCCDAQSEFLNGTVCRCARLGERCSGSQPSCLVLSLCTGPPRNTNMLVRNTSTSHAVCCCCSSTCRQASACVAESRCNGKDAECPASFLTGTTCRWACQAAAALPMAARHGAHQLSIWQCDPSCGSQSWRHPAYAVSHTLTAPCWQHPHLPTCSPLPLVGKGHRSQTRSPKPQNQRNLLLLCDTHTLPCLSFHLLPRLCCSGPNGCEGTCVGGQDCVCPVSVMHCSPAFALVCSRPGAELACMQVVCTAYVGAASMAGLASVTHTCFRQVLAAVTDLKTAV